MTEARYVHLLLSFQRNTSLPLQRGTINASSDLCLGVGFFIVGFGIPHLELPYQQKRGISRGA